MKDPQKVKFHEIGYQIRTLMSTITGLLELSMQAPPGENSREWQGVALQSARGVLQLLNQVLDPQKSVPVEQSAQKETTKLTDDAKGLRILVAEDNEINLAVVSRILTRRGHSVVSAANGEEALKQCCDNRFDLILMDLRMPTMNGSDAIRHIRHQEEETGKHVPIVALSAVEAEVVHEEIGNLIDGYIPKPFEARALFESIQVALTKAK